ncbi:MAG: hypothetical protein R3264_03670 [Anaerolineae bacterium]|nr:hypothetical protein [Anaerolineae bacterium]
MHLLIDGQPCQFIPLKVFISTWNLPEEFGVQAFGRKDWPVGSLDEGGRALNQVKQAVLATVPDRVTLPELLNQSQSLARIFRAELEQVNIEINLTQDQLDFAVDGLQNVLHDVVYGLITLYHAHRDHPHKIQAEFDFATLYQNWLNTSATIFAQTYPYQASETMFLVRIVAYAYGRIGLQISVDNAVYYVLDPTFACPAANFMGNLGQELALKLCNAFVNGVSSQPPQS